jgi:peptide/nickel transport system ATP-binding protein
VSALDPRQTAFQALREVLRVHGLLGGRDGLSEVRKLLGMVDLRWEDAHRLPHELSGGQCQRLAIARALAPSPTVLVADEPVSQLDVSTQAQILSLVDELRSRLGLTVVLIAHDLSVVRRVAERVAVMHAGMIVEEAPTEGIFERPLHPFTRLLLRSVPRSGARRQNAVNSRSRTSWPASGERCPFAERCQDRRAECTDTLPELRTVEDGRRAVRCLFA